MPVCSKCGDEKSAPEFTPSRPRECRACSRRATAAYRAAHLDAIRAHGRRYQRSYQSTLKGMLIQVRAHAKQRGIEFSLSPADLVIPEFCPVLGIRLERGTGGAHDGSPSVDRLDSSKGYVRGNVAVISHRANTIKSSGTVDEHERIVAWMRAQGESS